MVIPDSGSVVQQADNGGTSSLMASTQSEFGVHQDMASMELEEVRKLQELVRRLEVQNQTLRNRTGKLQLRAPDSSLPAGGDGGERTLCEGVTADSSANAEDTGSLTGREFERSPQLDSSSSEDMSPVHEDTRLEEGEGALSQCAGFLSLACGPGQMQGQPLASPSENYDSETLGVSDAGMDKSALDEVDVLDLEDCAETEDEDSWLYVSPKKQLLTKQGPESPLKWCRKVLDHPSPETEVACRTLISRLDQTSRWRNMYCSPSQSPAGSVEAGSSGTALLSPGYHKSTNKTLLTCGSSGYTGMRSALSSQSSIDSELSTSDDSISMGYKLQDLTDVQIMARLQEESLRQDYASSSASASRRSSTASLQSLRWGAHSDQELDSRSLEDEEDGCSSLPRRLHRHAAFPRCPSPGALPEPSRPGAPRARAPTRSLPVPGPELLKFARSEVELRHSMPNLAPRTSLRSLEAVRNSRSMEANLQSSGSRISRLTQSPTGVSSARLKGSGQSPLSLRAPMKALSPVGSMAVARQPGRCPSGPQGGNLTGSRRVPSPGPTNGGVYSACRTTTGGPRQSLRAGVMSATPTSRGRLGQAPRRSLGMPKTCSPVTDDSWKDGCY
ncbi:SLAIN motif-containing protein-like isoform X2 [Electrophorus electricus]|uniref:SLAIN motif-containing protein-like isoform X2 n=1 Tax=Electrophorus electricus TaxID=8005 RepID=UPI0015D091D5|nr:SLAIN motif-containing protein-like isoform X2 [Electrophorus electricus]